MTMWTVTPRHGAPLQIEAARFTTDGSGTRFVDEDGEMIAAFSDGLVASVIPTEPPPAE